MRGLSRLGWWCYLRSMRRAFALLVLCCPLAWSGCFDDVTTKFEPGLETLEDNEAPKPKGAGSLTVVTGEEVDYLWVHGRGLLAASPAEVWAALKDPDRVINRCQSDEQVVTTDVEKEYEFSFKVSYTVDTVVLVEWDEIWRYGTPLGDAHAPQLGLVRYQKTFGSDAIKLLEGSIEVLATGDPRRTEVQFVEHLDAFGGGTVAMTEQLEQRFAELKAAVAGKARPACPD